MRPKSLILLALALGCGLVASIGISQVLEARKAGPAPTGETENILVAMVDIDRHSSLSAQNVKFEEWPKDKIPRGAIRNLEEVEGRRPGTKIYEGEAILEAKLGTGEGVIRATNEIPKGYRVVTVRVNSTDGAGLIVPGDRVDVQVYVRRSVDVQKSITRTFLQDVAVFAVNSLIRHDREAGEATIAAKTISLLVTPKQATKVTMASQIGIIRLVMRGANDNAPIEDDEVTLRSILGDESEKFGEKEKEPQPSTAVTGDADNPSLRKWLDSQNGKGAEVDLDHGVTRMRLILGPDVHVVEFRNGEPVAQGASGQRRAATPVGFSPSGNDVPRDADAGDDTVEEPTDQD